VATIPSFEQATGIADNERAVITERMPVQSRAIETRSPSPQEQDSRQSPHPHGAHRPITSAPCFCRQPMIRATTSRNAHHEGVSGTA